MTFQLFISLSFALQIWQSALNYSSQNGGGGSKQLFVLKEFMTKTQLNDKT
jgi:hypothetical protein